LTAVLAPGGYFLDLKDLSAFFARSIVWM